jgi:trehalose/maltose hydrolase-like predicted phosphorylase
MARWNLERGLEVAALLARRWPERWARLRQGMALDPQELARWNALSGELVTGFDPATCLLEQFEGFHQLEPVDLAAYTPRTAPMDVLLGPEWTRRSQVIKQADVVMLLALLWDAFEPDVRAANFAYYEPRCGHGSSLSPATHALVAARLGLLDLAEHYFTQEAAIDLADTAGSAAQGIHLATQGGLWQTAVFGFAGLRQDADGLHIDPHLPASWPRMEVPIQWRGRSLRVRLEREPSTVSIALERGRPMTLWVGGQRQAVSAQTPLRCQLGRHNGGERSAHRDFD